MQSALNKIKKIFCITPAKRKRAIKVLFRLIFCMERKFPWCLVNVTDPEQCPIKNMSTNVGFTRHAGGFPRGDIALLWYLHLTPTQHDGRGKKKNPANQSHSWVHTRAAGVSLAVGV
jgi:hypothetical protein